ncbi:hypothetical protein [Niastella vici]|nr:hypothetical protein [Niastella vici]
MNSFDVSAGPDGTFIKSGDIKSSPADIDNFFSALQDSTPVSSPPKSITLYFHGGLVNETAGKAIAEKMGAHLQQAESIPVFFIWETSIKETISFKLTQTANQSFCKKLIRVLVKYLAPKTGITGSDNKARGTGRLSDQEIDEQLQQERPFDRYATNQSGSARGGNIITEAGWFGKSEMRRTALVEAELQMAVAREPDFIKLLLEEPPPELENEIANDRSRGFLSALVIKRLTDVVMKVAKRFLSGTSHGFYPTIVEELFRAFYIANVGAWVWDGMKSKARSLWQDNMGRLGDNLFAGSYFLESLERHITAFPQTKVHLVGHSAGSICICELLAAARQRFPALKFETIIFLAPACRFNFFYEQVVLNPHLFARFRCFTMTDENECNDVLVPGIYTRSLLYLVSGILEDSEKAGVPILGLHHFLGKSPACNDKDTWLEETEKFLLQNDRLVLSATEAGALAGLQTNALKHGDFDDNELTIESIKYMISH